MPEEETPQPLAVPVEEKNWTLRLILLAVVVVLAGVALFILYTAVPRWWAQRVGSVVDGSMTRGTVVGLLTGFAFTLGALVVLRQALRAMPWKLRIGIVVAAILVASPNLMTLGIVVGNGNAAHAGERILDVEAPAFRTASAWGAALGVAAGIALWVWVWRWRREREHLAQQAALPAPGDTDGDDKRPPAPPAAAH